MQLAISQVCSLHATLPQCMEGYAAGDCRALEIWLTALEVYLQQASLDQLRGLLRDHAMTIPAASYQGGLLASQAEERQVAWELFGRRLQLCAQLEIPTLILACDVPSPLRAGDVERVQVSLRQAAEEAARHQVRLALEFQVASAFGNNLQTAWALVEQAQHPSLGLCLDAFEFSVGCSKEADLQQIDPAALFHVQVSDLSATPRELAHDQHRILPGDGDLPLSGLVDYLRRIEYAGAIALEILNPQIWAIPPRQFGEIAMSSLQRLVTCSPQ